MSSRARRATRANEPEPEPSSSPRVVRDDDDDIASGTRRRECVLMLSDFFLPSIGGVELHIYALATRLRARGHKVVVFTHAQPGRVGVRWITSGIKVYHVPRVVMYDNCTFPNFFGAFKLFRKVRALDRLRSIDVCLFVFLVSSNA